MLPNPSLTLPQLSLRSRLREDAAKKPYQPWLQIKPARHSNSGIKIVAFKRVLKHSLSSSVLIIIVSPFNFPRDNRKTVSALGKE